MNLKSPVPVRCLVHLLPVVPGVQIRSGKRHYLALERLLASSGESKEKTSNPKSGGWIHRGSGRWRPIFVDSRSFMHHPHVKSSTLFTQREDFFFCPAIL